MKLKGSNYYFLNIWQKLSMLLLFFAEKVSSGMWEMCPNILGGYDY